LRLRLLEDDGHLELAAFAHELDDRLAVRGLDRLAELLDRGDLRRADLEELVALLETRRLGEAAVHDPLDDELGVALDAEHLPLRAALAARAEHVLAREHLVEVRDRERALRDDD